MKILIDITLPATLAKNTTLSRYLVLLLGVLGCIDKAEISTTPQELPIIIVGSMSDEPGPDTVKITRAYPADGGYYTQFGVSKANVRITSSTGESDALTDLGNGKYVTSTIQGVIGRTYQLNVTLPSGNSYTSTLQQMLPAGKIDTITYEYSRVFNPSTGLEEDGFDVFVNSSVNASSNWRLRYTFYGTYRLFTDPSQILIPILCAAPPCGFQTLPCATGCTCCMCWAYVRESSPIVIPNPSVIAGTTADRIFMQRIPINKFTFNDKYRVEITQMELSEEAFAFYSAIRNQAQNAASIFQPPFFELQGNLRPISGGPDVIGVFYAAAVTRKHIMIHRKDVPVPVSSGVIVGDCRAVVPNSTNQKPPFWE